MAEIRDDDVQARARLLAERTRVYYIGREDTRVKLSACIGRMSQAGWRTLNAVSAVVLKQTLERVQADADEDFHDIMLVSTLLPVSPSQFDVFLCRLCRIVFPRHLSRKSSHTFLVCSHFFLTVLHTYSTTTLQQSCT